MGTVLTLLGQCNAGALVTLAGLVIGFRGLRAMILRGFPIGIVWFRGFRMVAIGFGLTCAGLAGIWQQPWLLAVGMAIGMGETMESSFVLSVLTHERQQARAACGGIPKHVCPPSPVR